MRFLMVNMTELTVRYQPVPDRFRELGGRGLTSILVNDEVDATCDPLGPANKLVFAPGYFTGTSLVNTSRLSVGAKSPLTGGIKESNAGGQAGQVMARLGYAAIILEGENKTDDIYKVFIDKDKVEITLANEFKMLTNYDLAEKMKAVHGEKVAMMSIGPAGEMKLCASSQVSGLGKRVTLRWMVPPSVSRKTGSGKAAESVLLPMPSGP